MAAMNGLSRNLSAQFLAIGALQGVGGLYTAGVLASGHPGGVAEWSKAAVLKTAERELRGFESLLLRQAMKTE
jgi:hypothetical protein